MDVTLTTERLTLRPPTAADTSAITAGLNDLDVARHLTGVPYPYTQADAEGWIERQAEQAPGHVNFAVDLVGAGLIGVITLDFDSDLGYWLARPYHGHGYMTEACVALLDWHFRGFPDAVVGSAVHAGNAASFRVQYKLGFIETGESAMKFVRSQQKDILVIATSLARPRFEAARLRLGRPRWM